MRGATDPQPIGAAKAPFWGTIRMFVTHPVLMLAALGSGATQFVTYGVGNFAVLFLIREKGMTLPQIAVWYALVVAVGMGAGMVASGRVIDRGRRRSRVVYAAAPAISLAVALPFPFPIEEMAENSPSYTANRAVNAVAVVCAAAPGIRTTVDLPQVIDHLG